MENGLGDGLKNMFAAKLASMSGGSPLRLSTKKMDTPSRDGEKAVDEKSIVEDKEPEEE
jgi:hypothetical protein